MRLLPKDELLEHVQNIVHEDTQAHEKSIDLTADQISRINRAGDLDFGGSEFKPAKAEIIKPQKKNADDDYGWWNLDMGHYKIGFNEELSLDENLLAILSLHEHGHRAGLVSNTQLVETSGSPGKIIRVPDAGCNIKENARIATLRILEY